MAEEVIIDAEAKEVDANEVVIAEGNTQVATSVTNGALPLNPFASKDSFNDYCRMAGFLAKSECIPDNYKNKPMNCVTALEYANRLNVSPIFVMQNLNIIRGKTSWTGSACSMIVNASPRFQDVRLVFVGKEGTDDYGAYVTAKYRGTEDVVKGTTVTVKMAKDEGWWKTNTKWQNMTTQMLSYRAYSFFARVYCANELGGFYTDDELVDAKAKAPVDNPF